MNPDDLADDLPALLARAIHEEPDSRFPTMRDLQVAIEVVAKNRGFEPSSKTCAKFTETIFGHKAGRPDPRDNRPQSAVAMKMASDGLKTAFAAPREDDLKAAPSSSGGFPEPEDVVTRLASAEEKAKLQSSSAKTGGQFPPPEEVKTRLAGQNDKPKGAFPPPEEVLTKFAGSEEPGFEDQKTTDASSHVIGEASDASSDEDLATVVGGPRGLMSQSDGEAPDIDEDGLPAIPPTGKKKKKKKFIDQHQAITVMATPQKIASMTVEGLRREEKKHENEPAGEDPKSGEGSFPDEMIPTEPYVRQDAKQDDKPEENKE
jgi:hypothetical protein